MWRNLQPLYAAAQAAVQGVCRRCRLWSEPDVDALVADVACLTLLSSGARGRGGTPKVSQALGARHRQHMQLSVSIQHSQQAQPARACEARSCAPSILLANSEPLNLKSGSRLVGRFPSGHQQPVELSSTEQVTVSERRCWSRRPPHRPRGTTWRPRQCRGHGRCRLPAWGGPPCRRPRLACAGAPRSAGCRSLGSAGRRYSTPCPCHAHRPAAPSPAPHMLADQASQPVEPTCPHRRC